MIPASRVLDGIYWTSLNRYILQLQCWFINSLSSWPKVLPRGLQVSYATEIKVNVRRNVLSDHSQNAVMCSKDHRHSPSCSTTAFRCLYFHPRAYPPLPIHWTSAHCGCCCFHAPLMSCFPLCRLSRMVRVRSTI